MAVAKCLLIVNALMGSKFALMNLKGKIFRCFLSVFVFIISTCFNTSIVTDDNYFMDNMTTTINYSDFYCCEYHMICCSTIK